MNCYTFTSTTTNADSPTPDESNQGGIELYEGPGEGDHEVECFTYGITRAINYLCDKRNIHIHACPLLGKFVKVSASHL